MEIERIHVALDLQDDNDRKSINLIGVNGVTPSTDQNLPSCLPSSRQNTSRPATQNRTRPLTQQSLLRRRSAETSPTSFPKRPVVHLDKTCQGCSGNNGFVVSAFKMACLAYEPTPVKFRHHEYDRKHLIQTRSNILENFWSNVANSPPWNELSIMTIFDQGRPFRKTAANKFRELQEKMAQTKTSRTAEPDEKLIPDNILLSETFTGSQTVSSHR